MSDNYTPALLSFALSPGLSTGSVIQTSGHPYASPTPDLVHLTARGRAARRTNSGRKISVAFVGVDDSRVWERGQRSPAMLVCHPGCSDG